MCGLTGFVRFHGGRPGDEIALAGMSAALTHRGPDSSGHFLDAGVGLGLRRLSIIDLEGSEQPISNEDGSIVLVCNGEIFNYRNLRSALVAKGHRFRTRGDVEVIVHLYEDKGVDLLDDLRGQFSFVLYDRKLRQLFLARDHLGILPLFYTQGRDLFVFGSEIKAILEHPAVPRKVDLTGLDQVLTFPGLASPQTMFSGIRSLENGHYLLVRDGQVRKVCYWDLDYPRLGNQATGEPPGSYARTLHSLLAESVSRRLQADVPVGLYLSGGLDSSLIAALASRERPAPPFHSFSITFGERGIDESRYQRLIARQIGTVHHEIGIGPADLSDYFEQMILHAECSVKETYNACSLALSRAARDAGVKVVLAGEGADELFGGYPGYLFDQSGLTGKRRRPEVDTVLEEETRRRLWGDPGIGYERNYHVWSETKLELYSDAVAERFPEFDCRNFSAIDHSRLSGRHPVHQRSYLDLKLRLADHLLADHGDRMAMANSVEVRYPFLDLDVVEFAAGIPGQLTASNGTEKPLIKHIADGLVPVPIIQRQKFGFRAPGSPALLRHNPEWVQDILSPARIKRQGYFDASVVEALKDGYMENGHNINPHVDDDLLLIVLSFGVLLDAFGLPDYS